MSSDVQEPVKPPHEMETRLFSRRTHCYITELYKTEIEKQLINSFSNFNKLPWPEKENSSSSSFQKKQQRYGGYVMTAHL